MSEWQPIETAPKDGTVFLACNGLDVELCWWRERDADGWVDHFPWRFVQLEDGFISENGYSINHPPSHWMPLPEAPKI